jgi:hypothetical protein
MYHCGLHEKCGFEIKYISPNDNHPFLSSNPYFSIEIIGDKKTVTLFRLERDKKEDWAPTEDLLFSADFFAAGVQYDSKLVQSGYSLVFLYEPRAKAPYFGVITKDGRQPGKQLVIHGPKPQSLDVLRRLDDILADADDAYMFDWKGKLPDDSGKVFKEKLAAIRG